jgi:TAT (twin-arginine translocation) pathway signal sequence.
MMNISRRDFLKGTAAGALGLAATGLLSPVSAFAEGEKAAEKVDVHKVMAELNPQDYDFRDPD